MRTRAAARVGLALVWVAGCGAEAPPPPDVLLITVDTLRADRLGIYGHERETSPDLERWFRDGARFEAAWSAAASTPPGVVSILSGRLPADHGVRTFYQLIPPETELLPEWLGERYQSAAVVSNSVLVDEAIGLAGRFDHYDDDMRHRLADPTAPFSFERKAAATTDAALRFLDQARDPSRGLFLWVHYMDPHGPYSPPDAFAEGFDSADVRAVDPSRIQPYQRRPAVSDATRWVDDYDAEIAYTDAEIGRLLDGYASHRPADAALIVLTADHGETLLERRLWFRHRYQVFEEIVRVPLLLRGPGVASGARRTPVSTIDVAATVLAFAGIDPGDLPGRDLREPDSTPRVLFSEANTEQGQWRAARVGDAKAVVHLPIGKRKPDRARQYDLAQDPGERRPARWTARHPAAAALRAAVEADPDPGGLPLSNRRAGRRRELPPLDEAQRAKLRALGYLDED